MDAIFIIILYFVVIPLLFIGLCVLWRKPNNPFDKKQSLEKKATINTVIYVLSMPIVISLIFLVYILWPLPFHSPTQLQLNEITYRAQEAMITHWSHYKQCPQTKDLSFITELALVSDINISSNHPLTCTLSIQLKSNLADHALAGKNITQTYRFITNQTTPSYEWRCYTDAPRAFTPCKQFRDIESIIGHHK